MRVANNIIFSNLVSLKSGLQQARDYSKHIFNQNVNAAKTFEHNTREINQAATATKVDVDAKDTVGTSTTTSSFTQSNKKNQ